MEEPLNLRKIQGIDKEENGMKGIIEGQVLEVNQSQEYSGNKNKKRSEYKKLQNRLKKQRNKENRKKRRIRQVENQCIDLLNKDEKNSVDDFKDKEELIVFKIQENEELKRLFGESCKLLIGLDHQNFLEETENDTEKKETYEEENEENKKSLDNIHDGNEGISMKLLMEEEEDEDEEREEMEKKRRHEFLQEMKSRNNGVIGKMTVKELKEKTNHPELVEIWDTTAEDPEFLVYLKSCQGSVRIPHHWNSKRRYLQGKKGLERPPYKLPHFIEETKIAEIRALILEEESKMTMKQKQRRKIRPKLNRMDIDYQVLHDAFFIHSTKPYLTQFGDLYYEGKEFEFKFKNIRPGKLSQRLKDALGMQPNWPPPWLVRMQKYGPPPSYPYLRVPGVNSQIPNGCEFGFRPGEWGKPPLDDHGKPIWGLLPPIEDDDSNNSKNNSSLYSSAFDYWGEIEYDQLDDLENSDDNQQDELTEAQSHGTGILAKNTSINSNSNNSAHEVSSIIGAGSSNNYSYSVENPQGEDNNTSISVINPFLFTHNQANSIKGRNNNNNNNNNNEVSQSPLYTVLERKDLRMDNNSIFPSSYTYSYK
ncbi:Cus1p U2 snRNP [Cryptosporidium sp. chipmunk genotype I]|uniref:Cus1p U2 snRNP n=1 Tax=Cryptosporidium sp. chipmunk genotype I TaxID=1280935 RepID=UPI00351A3DDF|nr:Cus1p U2 snRNP [Cryptosporidium sp. chipmunk genotype I]